MPSTSCSFLTKNDFSNHSIISSFTNYDVATRRSARSIPATKQDLRLFTPNFTHHKDSDIPFPLTVMTSITGK